MKKGKTAKLLGYKEAKIIYGTVDSVNLKSIYLNIQTWVKPKKDCENWQRVVLNLNRSIKHSVLSAINNNIFEPKFIVDLDLRNSGLHINKKSFLNLEITFYLSYPNLDFKDREIKESLKKITTQIFEENFRHNDYFNFYLTKTDKKEGVLIQIDNY
jgi:hypothetical protein